MAALEEQVRKEQEDFEAGQGDGEDDAKDSTTTIENMAEEPEPTPPMQIPLEGFGDSITTTPGGDRPKSASIALRGGKLNVEGEFKKGDVVELYVRCRIGEVSFVDTHDKYGEVTGTERKHVAKPIAVRRLAATEE